MPVVLERLVMGALFGFVAMESLAAPIAMTDATGARVALSAPAERIVSLAPHATELLFAAGAGAHVVGVLAPGDWPPEAKRVPRVGDATGVDLERIVGQLDDRAVRGGFGRRWRTIPESRACPCGATPAQTSS